MSRRRLATVIVCSVFLLLIASTVHSMFSDIEHTEAESSVVVRDSTRDVAYTSGSPRARSHRSSEERDLVTTGTRSPDAGTDEVFIRELTLCIATDCWSRRGAGDGGVAFALPPPPPKSR